jgi:hypothetical protein
MDGDGVANIGIASGIGKTVWCGKRVQRSGPLLVVAALLMACVGGTADAAGSSLKGSAGAALRELPELPDCTFKPPAGVSAGDARLMRLEYEQQCYRLSETVVRDRLNLLKASTHRGAKPQPAPDCTFKSTPGEVSEKDARMMKLDYEAQCYRQATDILRAQLSALQTSAPTEAKPATRARHSFGHRSRHYYARYHARYRRSVIEPFQSQGR